MSDADTKALRVLAVAFDSAATIPSTTLVLDAADEIDALRAKVKELEARIEDVKEKYQIAIEALNVIEGNDYLNDDDHAEGSPQVAIWTLAHDALERNGCR